MIDISLVIPAFEEASRLGDPLGEIARTARELGRAEIVVVDDGSGDETSALVRRMAPELGVPVQALRYARNRGKGHALKVGFEAARGQRILFSDADLSTPPRHAEELLAALDDAEIAIGSRRMQGSEIAVAQPFLRQSLGTVFTRLVRWTIADVSDVTCGFKAFRAEVGKDLFSRVRVYDWSFDAEVLYLASQSGLRVAELPVEWHDQPGTKVRLGRDVLASLAGLAKIRWNGLRGVYRSAEPVHEAIERWEHP